VKSRTLAWIRLALTVLTFAFIAWYLRARPHLDFSVLHPRWGCFFLAAACTLPALGLRALKWKMLLRGLVPDVTYFQALRSYAGALSLGLLTPGRVGEFSRGWYLPQPAARGWRVAGLVLIDNWLDALAVLAWACLGWLFRFGATGFLLGLGAAAVLAPVQAWLRLAGRVTSRLPRLRGLRDGAGQGLAAGETVSGRDWARSYALAVAAFAFDWLQAALLLAFLLPGVPSPWRLAGIMAIVTLANSFQVTLAGLGMREGLAMVLLAGEGVGPEAAVAASFLQTCLGQFAPALAGLAARPVPESAGGTEGVGAAGATGAAGAAGAATPPPAPD
jgi:hypothetical protein